MVDHFSDLIYMHLMRRTIQGEDLAGKADFKIWAATFGVKIHIYHTGSGIFSEQPFKLAL